MNKFVLIFFGFMLLLSCHENTSQGSQESVIADGQMPNLTMDKSETVHLVYGNGDSVLYAVSSDAGTAFSKPTLISVLPKLAASHTRGPQIAATSNGLIVIACNESGDIYSYAKDFSGSWQQCGRVNDRDTVAKENLITLGADGNEVFAVWLDLRDKHNKLFGAKSSDGGRTWSKNILVYASPDTTVCECCKPSVQVNGKNVYVMFRNWLGGNRDMYVVQSNDGGNQFREAHKLGIRSWKLDGCPMDGGSLVVTREGTVQTVWRREGTIYAAVPGSPETAIGKGKSCTIASINGKNAYAWVEEGHVVILKPQGTKEYLGKGQLPVLKAVTNEKLLCVWEQDKQIHKAIVTL